MKQYNATKFIREIKSALVSYLASSLPIGNHANQEKLGEQFFNLWNTETFQGPFLETVASYSTGPSLCQMLSDSQGLPEKDRRFARRLCPKYEWSDIDSRFRDFLRARRQLWKSQTEDHDELNRLWRRPLYIHQLESLRAISSKHENVIVATGTGSGKTECFLLPILYRLLTEEADVRRTPGVRALLLYPMNALVEDQMARLRRLLFWLNLQAFDSSLGESTLARPITFGSYTGETKVHEADHGQDRIVSSEEIHELGEQRYRREMQAAPPDVLVTNFTMLEYMLLRSDDRNLFKNKGLFSFLVLDEVHTYHGTRGMEVSTLLLRLRDFLSRDDKSHDAHYICIGTSATLGTELDAVRKMAQFASRLFGSSFKPELIITGAIRKSPSEPDRESWESQSEGVLQGLLGLERTVPGICGAFAISQTTGPRDLDEIEEEEWLRLSSALASTYAPSRAESQNSFERTELLGRIMRASTFFLRLRRTLTEGVVGVLEYKEVAKKVFGEGLFRAKTEECLEALGRLLQLSLGGRVDGETLLTLRLHLFVKEHKQAFLCVNPKHGQGSQECYDGWWFHLSAHHQSRCEQCRGLMFPILLCRKCGFVFLEGWIRERGIVSGEKDELLGPGKFRRILFRPFSALTERLADRLRKEQKTITLCCACGQRFFSDKPEHQHYVDDAMKEHPGRCPGAQLIKAVEWSSETSDVKVEECPYCEQAWFKGQEVITPPTLSIYAAATLLLEEVKRAVDAPLESTGLTNKVLCFSDGRQQAALIASRLQRTNEDFTFRQLLFRSLREAAGAISTRELVADLTNTIDSDRGMAELFCEPEEIGDEILLRKRVSTLLFRETCTQYKTLESVGICAVTYSSGYYTRALQFLEKHSITTRFGPEANRGLAEFFLDWGFRFHRWAVSPGVLQPYYAELERYGYYDKVLCRFGDAAANASGFSLRRNDEANRLFAYYMAICRRARHLAMAGTLESFKNLVETFWSDVISATDLHTPQGDRLLRGEERPLVVISGHDPDSFQLKLNWLALDWHLQEDREPIFRCDTCGHVARHSVYGVCPLRDCSGKLLSTTVEECSQKPFSPVRHYLLLLRDKAPKPLRVEEHTAQISGLARRKIEDSFKSEEVGSVDVISGSTTFELGIDLGNINAIFLANMPPEPANYRQRAGRAGRRPGMLPAVVTYVRERPHDAYFWRNPEHFIAGPIPVPRFSAPSHEVLLRHANALFCSFLFRIFPQPFDLKGPIASDFVDFAFSQHRALRESVARDDDELGRGIRRILNANPSVHLSPTDCIEKFYARLEHFARTYLDLHRSDGAIFLFSDYGILPSYNYPIYVDELRLYQLPRTEPPRRDLKLQRDRSIALTEYFPGRIIVAKKIPIRSVGIWAGFTRIPFSFCKECSLIDTRAPRPGPGLCPNGCGPLLSLCAVRPDQGFAGETEPKLARQDPELFAVAHGQYLFDPAGNPPPPLGNVGRALRIARQSAFHIDESGARMRTFTPRPDTLTPLELVGADLKDVSVAKRQPSPCLVIPSRGSGPRERLYLMHEFTTDILRLQIASNLVGKLVLSSGEYRNADSSQDEGERRKARTILLWTFGQTLAVAGARLLKIDPSEIAFTFRHAADDSLLNREIILFDTASGGAGYCDQIFENLQPVFEMAAEVLECVKRCDDSCYSCLRSYDNQAFHTRLNRTYILEGLRAFNQANWT